MNIRSATRVALGLAVIFVAGPSMAADLGKGRKLRRHR